MKYNLIRISILLCVSYIAIAFNNKHRTGVFLIFIGDPLIIADVENESLYRENYYPYLECDEVQDKACGIITGAWNLTGTSPDRRINTTAFTISAIPGVSGAADGYMPQKVLGSGAGTFTAVGRD